MAQKFMQHKKNMKTFMETLKEKLKRKIKCPCRLMSVGMKIERDLGVVNTFLFCQDGPEPFALGNSKDFSVGTCGYLIYLSWI